jgi:polysaccharide pyruvyl transferase WcaK-like protein
MKNIGNDASLEAMLGYVRSQFPGATLDAMCFGPEIVQSRFRIPAIPLSRYAGGGPRSSAAARKAFSLLADIARTASWVRRHDVVIVPGTGVLESSLPLRPWGFPYLFFLVSLFGRVFRTPVALVCVGATPARQRSIRWLNDRAAGLAYYRSYRDAGSKEAMRQRGIGSAQDPVYTDLTFALPVPPAVPCDDGLVCVGVMDYVGSNDDRKISAVLRRAYVAEMVQFVEWLLDRDRRVRLVIGDANGSDDSAVHEITTAVRRSRPDLDPAALSTPVIVTMTDLVTAMQPARSVVAIRYHNVIAALLLAKPVLAVSYSSKQTALLTPAGLGEFGLPVKELDHDLLTGKFIELETRAPEIGELLARQLQVSEELLGEQFAELAAKVIPHR